MTFASAEELDDNALDQVDEKPIHEPSIPAMQVRRLDQTSDEVVKLLLLLEEMHSTSALDLPPLNMDKVVAAAAECENTGVIFIAAKPDGSFAGVLGLVETAHWFSDETFLSDRFFFVRQADRASKAADSLLNAAKKYASILKKPLSVAVWSGEDVERKDSFFERKGLRRVGGIYVVGLEKEAT
jgi:hypothetical protein